MIRRIYEAVTGQPWTTTRSATAEFGPPPGAVYADQLAAYTDADLFLNGRFILEDIRTRACECCQTTGTVLHPDDYRIIACPDCRPRQHAVEVAP